MELPIVDRLSEKRVVDIFIDPEDKVHLSLWEGCDTYFHHRLTKQEALALAKEIEYLASQLLEPA